MKFKDLNNTIKSKFVRDTICELYPFTIDDLLDFESFLDFKIISKNHYIDWNLDIVEKYTEKWDWSEIENNPIICKEINLALLFPDKVTIEIPKCTCFREIEYCNSQKFCNSEYDKSRMVHKKVNCLHANLYSYIKFLIEEKVLNNEVLNNILLYDLEINFDQDFEIDLNEVKSNNDYSDLPF